MNDEWGTPLKLFNDLDKEFNFTVDPCGISKRVLKKNMITLDIRKGQDGLDYAWCDHSVFVNPPFSRSKVVKWCHKIYDEHYLTKHIVLLCPLSIASTKYFHRYIYPIRREIRLLEGRVKYSPLDGQKATSPSFGSMIVIL